MTLELRKTGDLEPTTRPPVRQRVQAQLIHGRLIAVAVARRRGWSAWRATQRAATVTGRVVCQLPGVAVLLVVYSPRGAGRLLAQWVSFLRDDASAELRAHHAKATETGDYVRVSSVRSTNLRARALPNLTAVGLVLAAVLAWTAPQALGVLLGVIAAYVAVRVSKQNGWAELAAAAALGFGVYAVAPWAAGHLPRPPEWVWWLLGGAGVAVAGWAGRPEARPLVTLPEVTGGRVPRLTAPMVTAALVKLGNGKMKDPDDIKLLADPHGRGPGVQIDLELPVPATWVMDNREELATQLRRELGCVWPSVGKRHPGHLVLYVADQPMNQASQAPWPLLRAGRVDLFEPVPVATDQMGAWVHIVLAYCSGVIGAVPRQGKTFFLRELLLIAGLDPRARVFAFDGKGTGDLSPCELYAEYVGVGDEPEDIDEQLGVMRQLRAELRRRAKVIRALPREECPESKVTSALADRRDLGLEPIVVGVDETQTWFEYGDKGNKDHKAIRDELKSISTDLAKRGPALGFIMLLATQQVNADTIPTSISNNAVIRFCLKVFGHVANDQILGTGARKAGLDATMFDIEDKGIGYLRADGSDAQIVRSVFGLDAVAADQVAERARALRIAEGRLRDDSVVDAVVVLDEVEDAARALADRGRASAHLNELVEWLVAARPDYEGLDVGELGVRLRNRGVPTPQVKVGGRTNTGVRMADLRKRDAGEDADPTNPGGL